MCALLVQILRAVDQPAAVGLRRLGLRGEQVGARARLAHADREAQFAAADARQNVLLDVLGRVFQQDRPALPVGDEMQPHRRVGDAEFLGDDVAFEEAALMPAVFLRPGHADPAFGADAPAEFLLCKSPWPGRCGSKVPAAISSARNARTSCAQRFAFRRQADLIEVKTRVMRVIRSARRDQRPEFVGAARGDRACRAPPPSSSRCRNRRARRACAA